MLAASLAPTDATAGQSMEDLGDRLELRIIKSARGRIAIYTKSIDRRFMPCVQRRRRVRTVGDERVNRMLELFFSMNPLRSPDCRHLLSFDGPGPGTCPFAFLTGSGH